jgi:ferritin
MLSKALSDALNTQLTRERFASAVYLSFSGQAALSNLPGFEKWMRAQSKEETEHADGFFDYLVSQNIAPAVQVVDSPEAFPDGIKALDFASQALTAALKLEQQYSGYLRELHAQAMAEEPTADTATAVFLQPYIAGQVTSEHEIETMLGWMSNTDQPTLGMLLLDRKLEAAK